MDLVKPEIHEVLSFDLQSIQEARTLIGEAQKAQKIYREFTQEQIDAVVAAVAAEARNHAEPMVKATYSLGTPAIGVGPGI
jgi:predicted alpha/beta hydrolase